MTPAGPAENANQQVRALAPKLARTELMSPDEFQGQRAPLVAKFLAHARQNAAFYRDRFGFDVHSPREVSERWSQIPILTRADAVKHRDSLLSLRTPPEAGPVTEKETSGSTGMPLRYRSTESSSVVNSALTERLFRWWRVDGNKPYAQIAYPTAVRDQSIWRNWRSGSAWSSLSVST